MAKSYATSYVRNDSTTSTATRNVETLTIPSSVLNVSAGTISCWAIPEINASNLTLIAFSAFYPTSLRGKYWVGYGSAGWGCPDIGASTTSVPYTAGTPVHLSQSWNGSTMTIYVNGVKIGSGTTSNLALDTSVYVGSRFDGFQFAGTIDELATFNRALTDAEVMSLYMATQPLVDVFQTQATTLGAMQQVNGVATKGNFGVSAAVANVSEQQLTTTSATNVLTFTPTVAGNYLVYLNIRVANAQTLVMPSVTWTDASGTLQTNNYNLPNGSYQNVGAWAAVPLFINATTATPITITVMAGTANNAYVSASIIGL